MYKKKGNSERKRAHYFFFGNPTGSPLMIPPLPPPGISYSYAIAIPCFDQRSKFGKLWTKSKARRRSARFRRVSVLTSVSA